MQTRNVTRRFLRLRSGVALAILLVAACVALLVTHYGRVAVDRRDTITSHLDAAMVAASQASRIFDQIQIENGVVNGSRLRSDLRSLAARMSNAHRNLEQVRDRAEFAAETASIVELPAIDPLGTLAEMIAIAERVSAGSDEERVQKRASQLGGQLADRLFPVLLRMKETERLAGAAAGRKLENLAWLALAISITAILAAIRFVHLPMESRILSAQERIDRARRDAEIASDAKTKFLATMSHEIRTPMNGILGMAELMRKSDLQPRERAMLETIATSGTALMEIIDDVLDISKIEAGKVQINNAPLDVAELCGDVIKLFSGRAESKGVELELENQHPDADWRRIGDAKSVRQVLSNLVGNAIKFTDSGKVTLALSVEPGTTGEPDHICISVADQGIGIPEAAQAKIFESYEQAESTTSRDYGGTGLGLSIVRKLTYAMNGEIALSSEVGVGSVFTIRLPMEVASAPDSIEQEEPARVTELTVRRVLVADDNEVNRMIASKFLENAGCEASFATNGSEAVELAQKTKPDLILMDGAMPIMDGIQATRAIRLQEQEEARPRTPIIALSAQVMAESVDQALEAGMDGYLTKPLQQDELKEVLTRDWSADQ